MNGIQLHLNEINTNLIFVFQIIYVENLPKPSKTRDAILDVCEMI